MDNDFNSAVGRNAISSRKIFTLKLSSLQMPGKMQKVPADDNCTDYVAKMQTSGSSLGVAESYLAD